MIRKSQSILTQIYALCDFCVIQIVFFMAWWIKFNSGIMPAASPLPKEQYYLWTLVYSIIVISLGFLLSFYSPKRKKRFSFEILKIIQVHLISLLILLSLLFINKELDISRQFLAVLLSMTIITTSIYRYIVKMTLRNLRTKGYNKQFVLILGAGSLGRKFYDKVQQQPDLGVEIIGFLDDFHTKHDSVNREYKPILGMIDNLENILESVIVDEVIIALPLAAHDKYGKIINVCEKAGIRTMIIPDFYDILPARPYFDHFAGIPLINVRDIPLDDMGNRLAKRAFDIVFSLFALIVTSPVLAVVAVAIKLTSPGPVIFKQERVGLNRRMFSMYKFRSMRQASLKTADTGWTTENDVRKTKIGAFIRKTSLDELPQFFNVLFGHMSVVGPRPERPFFVDQFKEEIPKYMVKHHIRPGITGWAQSNGLRGDTSIEERISLDIFYIENWTFLFDIKIIWLTIYKGFVNKNAY
ncbi:undecaprenyl-phosphate glucose phosphotransferase [Paenibacillus psychroresistens]|uniref:Undecaprenyl-phosphate glucose phosphotransferase n=1 Tax=Paenibacillus psychroresistens TaxID=1778678 RepID=A0A6B8RSE2_9BACL|nr:undecaprenyl-phosphate glucose phosphotransferase [Paenibacillus psychroresistens]QGQ98465.1 undecaprenyl-phosphate glucose phosphotransferase [Paenibacillus psychroresistens]